MRLSQTGRTFQQGFTLLEMMTVVAMIAILAALAIPSYERYVRRANESMAQSEALRVANLLELWRARNLTYLNFNLTTQPQVQQTPTSTVDASTMYLPVGSTPSDYRYILRVVDADTLTTLNSNTAIGRNFALRLEPQNSLSQIMLITSTGLRCQSSNPATDASFTSYKGCGTGAKPW